MLKTYSFLAVPYGTTAVLGCFYLDLANCMLLYKKDSRADGKNSNNCVSSELHFFRKEAHLCQAMRDRSRCPCPAVHQVLATFLESRVSPFKQHLLCVQCVLKIIMRCAGTLLFAGTHRDIYVIAYARVVFFVLFVIMGCTRHTVVRPLRRGLFVPLWQKIPQHILHFSVLRQQ